MSGMLMLLADVHITRGGQGAVQSAGRQQLPRTDLQSACELHDTLSTLFLNTAPFLSC